VALAAAIAATVTIAAAANPLKQVTLKT